MSPSRVSTSPVLRDKLFDDVSRGPIYTGGALLRMIPNIHYWPDQHFVQSSLLLSRSLPPELYSNRSRMQINEIEKLPGGYTVTYTPRLQVASSRATPMEARETQIQQRLEADATYHCVGLHCFSGGDTG